MDMVTVGVRRLVREGTRVRVVNPFMKDMANHMVKEVSNKGMSARSGSSNSAQTILSANGEVGFKSIQLYYLALYCQSY